MKQNFIPLLLLLLVLGGCATAGKPMVQIEEGVSLKRYIVFEVPLCLNETGKSYDFNVTDELTKKVQFRLKDKGYLIEEGKVSGDTLIIKNSLMSYKPGSAFKRWLAPGAGTTHATVKTSLIDKKTGNVIGEMITDESISAGGLYSVGAYKQIFDVIAKGIVNEIDTRVKGQ